MRTTVAFASKVSADPGLVSFREGGPFLFCEIPVLRRQRNDEGERSNTERTLPSVVIGAFAATHVEDTSGSGDPVSVRSLGRTGSWLADEIAEKLTRNVVVDGDGDGVGVGVGVGVGEVLVFQSTSPRRTRVPSAPRRGLAEGGA